MDENKGWNPYFSGALSGVVAVLSVWFTGKYFGASTTFVRTTGMLEGIFTPERIAQMPYFMKELPKIDWQWMFVIGIGVAAFIAAKLVDDFKIQKIPTMWEQHFGSSLGKRGAFAFIGGSIAMFGARLADGCPSGHGLSGVSQLAVSGIVALAMFFLGGLIGTYFLYGRGTK